MHSLITIYGGDKPHIVGVAMSVMSPSLQNSDRLTRTDYMLAVQGHKETEFAKNVASDVAIHFKCTATVVCGKHFFKANEDEILGIIETVNALKNDLVLYDDNRYSI